MMLFSLNSIAQQRSVLEKKKGFREIKLRANISDYDFFTLASEQDLSFNMEFIDDTRENMITEERKFENVNLKYDEVDVYSVNPGTDNYQVIDGGTIAKDFISTRQFAIIFKKLDVLCVAAIF